MPSIPVVYGPPDPSAIRVLITGFGPYWRYQENPSWLAVQPLHNTILYAEIPTEPPEEKTNPDAMDADIPTMTQQIHITTLQIPVTYQSVLSTVPGLHLRPAVLPPIDDPTLALPPPPQNGYDFIFHIGIAGRGPLRVEKIAHKLGYRMKDGDGQYAPVVHLPKEFIPVEPEAQRIEMQRMLMGSLLVTDIGPPMPNNVQQMVEMMEGNAFHTPDTSDHQPSRGFGKGYENSPDELTTDIDVPRLIHHLKETGIETVYSSMDAGHHLTDFTFYCSLAEAKRVANKLEKDKARSTPPKATPVLAMHCGPVDQPMSTEEVTEALKKVVLWVCTRSESPAAA